MELSRRVYFVVVLVLVGRVGEPRSVGDAQEDVAVKKSL